MAVELLPSAPNAEETVIAPKGSKARNPFGNHVERDHGARIARFPDHRF